MTEPGGALLGDRRTPRTRQIAPAAHDQAGVDVVLEEAVEPDAKPNATFAAYASSAAPVSAPKACSPAFSLGETSITLFLRIGRIRPLNRLRKGRTEVPRIDSPAVTRLSRYFLPTEKEAPADAEALSHKLMVRAGLVRQVGAGLWTWLPAGWRVHQKVEQIVREEMDAIGGQEMLMPVLQPGRAVAAHRPLRHRRAVQAPGPHAAPSWCWR